jgi:hypothetical protein
MAAVLVSFPVVRLRAAFQTPNLKFSSMIQRIIFLSLLPIFFTPTAYAQRFCATMEYDSLLRQRHAGWQQDRAALEAALQQKNWGNFRIEASEETIRIPVVVHVIHNQANSQPGTEGNISDAQIRSQIDVLNEDYRRKPNTRGFNDNPVGADVNIEFFLATCDPNGKASSGITRTYNAQKDFDLDISKLTTLSYWPSDQYMNIWVTDVRVPYIGYAQFPDMSGLEGLSSNHGPVATDGLVLDYKVFGRQTGAVTSALYGYGRTTTHEVGHWLGLKHTWGDDIGNCDTDYCDDTPPTRTFNQANDNSCTPVFSDCEGPTTRNMIENYMDYTPDVCMNIFTQDQKARMWKVLQTSPRRKSLVANASRCKILLPSEKLSIEVFPNPADGVESNGDVTYVDVLLKDSQDVNLQVYDALGRIVYAEEYTNMPSRRVSFSNRQLKNGMYFVSVTTSGGEKVTTRLVVIR